MQQLSIGQNVKLVVAPTTPYGLPVQVQDPLWESSNPFVIGLVQSEDGMSAQCVAMGDIGKATITFTGKADLSKGVSAIKGTHSIETTLEEGHLLKDILVNVESYVLPEEPVVTEVPAQLEQPVVSTVPEKKETVPVSPVQSNLGTTTDQGSSVTSL